MIFPSGGDVKRFQMEGTKVYSPLLSYLDSMGYRYIDLMDAFAGNSAQYDVKELYLDPFIFGHHSPYGNKIVAEHIYGYLIKKGYLDARPVN